MEESRILEAKLCYAVIVAGKSAQFADNATGKLWAALKPGETPFGMFRSLGSEIDVRDLLRSCSTGNYRKTSKCFWQLATQETPVDLRTCEPIDLEKFHGIGPKTSRFFILWTRPEAVHAALDVHILRWLTQQGYSAPVSTPPAGKRYYELEAAFIAEARSRGMSPRQLDWEIWSTSTRYKGTVQAQAESRAVA